MAKVFKDLLNRIAGRFDARFVNRDWGPRGFSASFAHLKRLGFNPKSIFDVGASNGEWSLELSQVLPDSSFFLFEPLRECKDELDLLEKTRGNFRYFDCAVGASNKLLEFTKHKGQSSLLNNQYWSGEKETVHVYTLDSLVDQHSLPSPDLIKADIQGYELEMLKGASSCLQKCSFVFLEISWLQLYDGGCSAGEVMGFLSQIGYHVFDICTYSIRPVDKRLVQSDVLFAHDRTGLFSDKRWSK
ncbi:MAG: FkbM family methyltransferase [Pirellula sp.]|jgi:FkbM family methyltransferase|nr:FkbM family methyltransferase [Pirellula sp.]